MLPSTSSHDPSNPPFTLLQQHNTMGSDDYAAIGGGGALKLKGAKVHKKKKKRDKTDLEKNLDISNTDEEKRKRKKKKDKEVDDDEPRAEDEGEEKPEVQKTEAQKRHEEIKKKRVSALRPRSFTQHRANMLRSSSYSLPNLQAHDQNYSKHTRSELRN